MWPVPKHRDGTDDLFHDLHQSHLMTSHSLLQVFSAGAAAAAVPTGSETRYLPCPLHLLRFCWPFVQLKGQLTADSFMKPQLKSNLVIVHAISFAHPARNVGACVVTVRSCVHL